MSFSRPRQGVAIEINPRHVLVAGLGNWQERPLEIESIQEFDREDRDGLRHWLRERHEKTFAPALVSFYPAGRILHRDSLVPRRLAEPDYLPDFAREKFAIANPAEWHLHLLHPLEGEPIEAEGAQRPVLISAMPHAAVREIQQWLLDFNLMPYRLEVGTLPLLGSIFRLNESRSDTRATVVVEIEESHTTVAILGKEGVHTPAPVKQGFDSLIAAARREFDLPDDAAAREFLRHTSEDLDTRARRLVRALARELKPVINSYELTTGQRIGELYCSFLSRATAWVGPALAGAMDLEPFPINCDEWHVDVQLRATPGLKLPPHWFPLLSLLAGTAAGAPHGEPA